jgi:hypothetical protein|tara:strand:- start:266 stop:463 length:198 start_codon:yes stop_codon:yes gene_type:complete
MIPLMTRRSSTRRALDWFFGKSGSIAAQARSESQNPDAMKHLLQQTAWRESARHYDFKRLIGFGA